MAMSENEMQVEGFSAFPVVASWQEVTAIDDGHGTLWIIDYRRAAASMPR
jgi:hypothetical protein